MSQLAGQAAGGMGHTDGRSWAGYVDASLGRVREGGGGGFHGTTAQAAGWADVSDIGLVIGTHTHRKGTVLGAVGAAYPFHRQQHGDMQGARRGQLGISWAGVKNLRHHAYRCRVAQTVRYQ